MRDLGVRVSRGVLVPCLGLSLNLESMLVCDLVCELLFRELVVKNHADNAEQPGRLRLERAAARAYAKTARLSEQCCVLVCTVNSQCAGRGRLNGHPAGFQSVKGVALRYVQPSF